MTHRGLGLEHLLAYKNLIVDIFAMLVHMIDDMDAQLTSISDRMQNNPAITNASGTKIKFNNSYLNILTT